MEKLKGYCRTLALYYKNPKGHHDIIDYARCGALIIAAVGISYAAIWLWNTWK
jgi:hypothetical protein